MKRGTDGNGSLYIAWKQPIVGSPHFGYKRAWVQHREGDRDWAGTRRYINVARTETLDGGPSGNATDFPIYSALSDEQALLAFVSAVCAVTGCELPPGHSD
jgi:hypothetical protein